MKKRIVEGSLRSWWPEKWVPGPFGLGGRGSLAWTMVALAVFVWVSGCGFFVKPSGDMLPVQEQAPEFSLQDQNGETVSLRGVLDRGPALVVFYRGHW